MRNVEIIDKPYIRMQTEEKLSKGFIPKRSELVGMVKPFIGSRTDSKVLFEDMEKSEEIRFNSTMSEKIITYGGAMFVPRTCQTASVAAGKKVEMSAYDMLQAGYFTDPKMSGNTLPADWQYLWDALRVDISIRVGAQPTVRENFYNMLNNPNASKVMNMTELYPYAFEFVLNNGEGQAVQQGETRAGGNETVEHYLYSTGFTRTLLSELFDASYDPQKVSDGVAIAYNAKCDDLSISPILNFTYSGVTGSQTPADSTGANRQEKLFNTLENAIDHLGRRLDPISGRQIAANDLAILCENEDARHIQRIVNGLPAYDNPKILPPITNITSIVAYDGETITGRIKDVTYTGVTRGKCYLIKKNRYMNVSIKRALQMETDMRPDVTTLARERQSWYFCEGQQTTGLSYFVQEVTLPTYTPSPS